jgi:DNA-binding transcriptional LysR family regulator
MAASISQQELNWHDLRFFLAVARGESLSATARTLKVDRSTVLRRIRGLEAALDVRLFKRDQESLDLTEPGEELLEIAARIEDEMVALVRRVAGRNEPLTGTVRVATTDSIAFAVLPAHLARFHAAHPRIKVELVASPRLLNITKREADVGFIPVRDPDGAQVGRKLCATAVSIYGSRRYLDGRPPPRTAEDLRHHDMIASDDSLSHFPITRWVKEHVVEGSIVYRTNSLLMQLAAVQEGVGLAYLPCFLTDPLPDLVRIFPADIDMSTDLWIVTHGDLRQASRIRAFIDFMARSIVSDRDFLEGRRRTSALSGVSA